MKVLVQRCKNAKLSINDEVYSQISYGYVLFVGFENDDDQTIVDKMIAKILKLRICSDENQKLNLNISQINGEIMSVSQFTLYANCIKGNRPGFSDSLNPQDAEELYNYFNANIKKQHGFVKTGQFGADMQVELVNDGPLTIMLDSAELFKKGV